MNMTTQPKTIMFADIVSSTHLYRSPGDKRAKETIDTCMKTHRTCLSLDLSDLHP